MNRPATSLISSGLFSALLIVTPVLAGPPVKKPLADYRELWEQSPFTIAPVPVEGAQEPPQVAADPKDQEIAALKKRVTELEQEVQRLKLRQDERPRVRRLPSAPPRKKDTADPNPAPLKKADADDRAAWIAKFEPAATAPEQALADLEAFASQEAQRRGLLVNQRKVLPNVKGTHYRRIRVALSISGHELLFYRWLDRLQDPTKFRAVTSLTISPKRDDDTLVETRVIVEQWHPVAGAAKKNDGEGMLDAKWSELQPVVEAAHWPVELLLQVAKARPDARLRFSRLEVLNEQVPHVGAMRSIMLVGRAEELNQVMTFQQNLKKSEALKEYTWSTPSPSEEARTGQWAFVVQGIYKARGW